MGSAGGDQRKGTLGAGKDTDGAVAGHVNAHEMRFGLKCCDALGVAAIYRVEGIIKNEGAAGGLIGALTDSGVDEEDAHVYAEGVRRGGTLVTARVEDSVAPRAEAILKQRKIVDPAARRSIYAQEGWSRFDENADPYTLDQVERERERYRGMMP
jgi:hypothetical protein